MAPKDEVQSSREMTILFDLLQGRSGENFSQSNDGWDRNTPVCEWHGIGCDSSGSITKVDLSSSKLQGSIPSSLAGIQSLEYIFLGGNEFSGSIPSEVTRMQKLRNFDVSFNKLTGPIQLLFPLSTSMEVFVASHNQLSGSLPQTFLEGLANLNTFDLRSNKINGILSQSASVPSSLQTLDLSDNLLYGKLPAFIGETKTLQRLYLSKNSLSGTIPTEFGTPSLSLREIFLHGNILTGTLPSNLANLPLLEVLFVQGNELTGSVPEELCQKNLNSAFFAEGTRNNSSINMATFEQGSRRSLQQVSRGRNGCNSIACPAGSKSLLQNNNEGVFPCMPCSQDSLNPFIGSNKCFNSNQDTIIQTFYNATNGPAWNGGSDWLDNSTSTCEKEGIACDEEGKIVSIILKGKGLSGSIPPDIGFLPNLRQLDLSNNQIEGRIPAELRFAPLKVFDISENMISGVVPFGLCLKEGINGNGKEGVFTCDAVACRVGYHSSTGHAGGGSLGEVCSQCTADSGLFLGTVHCRDALREGITPFGFVGEMALAVFGATVICVVIFVWRQSKTSTQYITDRAYASHAQTTPTTTLVDRENSQPDTYFHPESRIEQVDPLDDLDGLGIHNHVEIAHDEVDMAANEWTPEAKRKEQDEVWLDVPKIQ